MFKKEEKKMLKEEREDKMIMGVSKDDMDMVYNLVDKAISPVFFIDDKEYCTPQPYSQPLYQYFWNNMKIVSNINQLKDLSKGHLTRLGNLNNDRLITNIREYIRQFSFSCFCSYLNNIEIDQLGLLDYIPLREFADKYIKQDTFGLTTSTFSYLMSSIDSNVSDSDVNDNILFMVHLSKHFSNIICSSICKAIDDSLNYVLFMKYQQNFDSLGSNYEKVKNIVYKQFANELKEISKSGIDIDKNFNIVASGIIKNTIIKELPSLIVQQIEPAIFNVLSFIPFSGFYVFNDYKKSNYPDKYDRYQEDF